MREGLERQGLLCIGDGKMAALATRAFVQAGDDFDLGPLSQTRLLLQELATYLAPVWDGEQELTDTYRQRADGEQERIAEGFTRLEGLTAEVDGETII